MSKIKVGDIVECVVTGVQSYGAFVLIDNSINGLIHISEISKGYVRNIEDFVKVGETVYVKILELDEEDLRAKELLQGTWIDDITETPLLQIKGDTIYYLEETTNPSWAVIQLTKIWAKLNGV